MPAGKFAIDLRRGADEAWEDTNRRVRATVFELQSRLVQRSPVDKGRFRSNWYYSAGGPITAASEATNIHVVNGGQDVPTIALGCVHYIQNNLPYALPLEIHGATKASNAQGQIVGPGGIVGITVLEFQSIVDGTKAKT